jgi:futalosine hydrolase
MKQYSVLWVVATGMEARALGVSDILPEGFYPDMPAEGHAVLVSGVGMLATAVSLTKVLAGQSVGLIVNFGVCGSFRSDLAPGTVVQVVDDELGDFGAEDHGNFLSAFDLGFVSKEDPRYINHRLRSSTPVNFHLQLPEVTGVTVNTVHGSSDSIRLFKERCVADVETMEGAAVFFVAADFRLPVIQLRAVSNFVEPRNRDGWKMKEALDALEQVILDIQKKITTHYS